MQGLVLLHGLLEGHHELRRVFRQPSHKNMRAWYVAWGSTTEFIKLQYNKIRRRKVTSIRTSSPRSSCTEHSEVGLRNMGWDCSSSNRLVCQWIPQVDRNKLQVNIHSNMRYEREACRKTILGQCLSCIDHSGCSTKKGRSVVFQSIVPCMHESSSLAILVVEATTCIFQKKKKSYRVLEKTIRWNYPKQTHGWGAKSINLAVVLKCEPPWM